MKSARYGLGVWVLVLGCGGIERVGRDSGTDGPVSSNDSGIDTNRADSSNPDSSNPDSSNPDSSAPVDGGLDSTPAQDSGNDSGGGGNTYYADCDGDGFAALGAAMVVSASLPIGAPACGGQWITLAPVGSANVDCRDNDNRARPNLAADIYYGTPINGTSSYDFNCDGSETQEPVSGCSGQTPSEFCTTVGREGACTSAVQQPCWTSVPAGGCGSSGTYRTEIRCTTSGGCTPQNWDATTRGRGCR